MKTLGVRVSELEQKRLSEFALKRGGTVSDSVREIITKFFTDDGKAEIEKQEHEKTRSKIRDVDNALASNAEEMQALKNGFESFKALLTEFVKATVGEKK